MPLADGAIASEAEIAGGKSKSFGQKCQLESRLIFSRCRSIIGICISVDKSKSEMVGVVAKSKGRVANQKASQPVNAPELDC